MHSWDHALIGTSKCFLQATGMIPMLSASKSTVLISGETGTGKELFARAIHYSGERRSKPFVPVNCAALPDHLIENELFGHSKGAFTGALIEKPGLLQEADGGTLFLDEINSLSLSVQSKLLRVLQDQEFRPLGSTKSKTVNVKIIAATNADLRHLVETRQFREDLFYRLNVLSHFPASLTRPERGHPASRQSFSQGVCKGIREAQPRSQSHRQGKIAEPYLARQRQRVARGDSAGRCNGVWRQHSKRMILICQRPRSRRLTGPDHGAACREKAYPTAVSRT